MDRLIQLQQGRHRTKLSYAIPEESQGDESEDDVADYYTYIPRRKGDFPPLAFEVPDVSPANTRYEIVDREFEHDVPVYVVRPKRRDGSEEVNVVPTTEGPLLPTAQESDGSNAWTDRQEDAPETCLTSARPTPSSSVDAPAISALPYDPNGLDILRVDLFDIYSYVSQRELERFETYRFEHPKPEDYPIMVPMSRGSSVVEREERAQHREEIKAAVPAKPKGKPGRPPKKKGRFGPMVVVHSPRASSETPLLGSRGESEDLGDLSSMDVDATGDVAYTIEETVEELDLLDMSTSLRGTGGMLGKAFEKKTPTAAKSFRDTQARSRLGSSSSSAERQIPLESREQVQGHKRRGRPPKDLNGRNGSASASHINPPSAAFDQARLTHGNGLRGASASTSGATSTSASRSSSGLRMQTTMDDYFRSTASEAREPPLMLAHRASPRRQTPPPTKVNGKQPARLTDRQVYAKQSERRKNGKQPVSRSRSVQPPEPAPEDMVIDDEDYEISHIILHDDSRGERYYLVAWKGYGSEDATWLTETELQDAQDALQEYLHMLAAKEIE
jgi:hypothetical protein